MFIKHIINIFSIFIIFTCDFYIIKGDIPKYEIDIGENISIPCGSGNQILSEYNKQYRIDNDGVTTTEDDIDTTTASSVYMWLHEGRNERHISRFDIQPNGTLVMKHVNQNDSGVFSCYVDGEYVKQQIQLIVRSPPPPLVNVTVSPSTILAVILWSVKGDGGYPIIDFTAEYRLANANQTWKPIAPNHIPPNLRQIDVYRLEPNTTYEFRVWATNQLGTSEPVVVEAKTLHKLEEIELARHLLAGVENFDTRVWVAAVGIVMGTLVILTIGTCYLLYIESHSSLAKNICTEI